jgi:FkbM family methyltransferase
MVDIAIASSDARHVLRPFFPRTLLNWREARFYGRYGEVELHLLEALCRRDADAIDVGAHDGSYVHYMQHHARRVAAFEPLPRLAKALREKFRRRVVIEGVALSDHAGRMILHVPIVDGIPVDGCATASAYAATTYPHCRTIEVPVDTLDNIYRGRVGLLKIDVEGHEQAVLEGAADTIARDRPRILIQIDERLSPGGLDKARNYFDRRQYSGYFVHNNYLKPVERFSVTRLQHPGNLPDLLAPLHARSRFGRYVCNFIFLPAEERQPMILGLDKQLAKLRARLGD